MSFVSIIISVTDQYSLYLLVLRLRKTTLKQKQSPVLQGWTTSIPQMTMITAVKSQISKFKIVLVIKLIYQQHLWYHLLVAQLFLSFVYHCLDFHDIG